MASSHLSIGEVLSLIQADFPEVTISKIRFLESQGLLDPERTPSGYRKFYETDIDRLRWILEQQRDNFLPLRVIKDRLDEWDATGVPPASATPDDPPATDDEPVEFEAVEPLVDPEEVDDLDDVAAVAEDAPPAGDDEGDVAAAGGETADVATPETVPVDAEAEAGDARPSAEVGKGTSDDDTGLPSIFREARARRADASRLAALQEAPPSVTPPEPPGARADAADARRREPGPSEPTSLTRAELGSQADLDEQTVGELESYGLIGGRRVGAEVYYEPDCIPVVAACATFLRHGVEPRHLRMYKIAAEREAGFFEQLIMPLLKQRNPEARAKATATVNELVEAGESIHASVLRRLLDTTLP